MDKKNQLIENLNKIALEVTLCDFSEFQEIENIYIQLLSLSHNFQAIDIKNFDDLIKLSNNFILALEAEEKQSMISFTIDFLQNFLSCNETTIDVVLFNKETLKLLGRDKDTEQEEPINTVSPEIINELIITTSQYIEDAESTLLEIEKGSRDPEKIHLLFRAFHTIKSDANLLGFLNVGKLSHKTEDLLDKIRSGNLSIQEKMIHLLFEVIDTFRNFLDKLSSDTNAARNFIFDEIIHQIEDITIEKNKNITENDQISKVDMQEEKKEQKSLISDFTPCPPDLDLSEGNDMLLEFISEAREHLSNSEEAVLTLESNPEDMDAVNLIFRAFHTIKGLTSFLNLNDIKTLAHTSETMLDLVRKATLTFDETVADATLTSIDQLRTLLSLLEKQIHNNGILAEEYFDIRDQLSKLDDIIQGKKPPAPQNKIPIGEILISQGSIQSEELDKALELQINQPEKKIGEILQEMKAVEPKDVNRALNTQNSKMESSIKINVEKLDTLIDLVGELVISETQVIQNHHLQNINDNRLTKDLAELDRITRSLQQSAMSMRLIPVKSTFQKMVRIIRDLSKKTGKEINVKLVGEDTEIDKNMVELISDPLVHMVRNSADHGIESPSEREAKGKAKNGTITLSAFHKAGNVVIQISDDGAGLNKDKIILKAIAKGLVKENETLPDKRIWNLIFEPGFSTAEKITDVSGRGVGMDVVRKNIEQLRGKIDIQSEMDRGSTFSIYLPITLAIIEGIVVSVGPEKYILPINSVVEFVSPDINKKNNVIGQGEMYRFHDEVLQIINLDQLFKITSDKASLQEKTICVCDSEHGRNCFVVDEVLGQQQVVIKNLGERIKNLSGISGGAILGDGRVGLILDINGVVEFSRETSNMIAATL